MTRWTIVEDVSLDEILASDLKFFNTYIYNPKLCADHDQDTVVERKRQLIFGVRHSRMDMASIDKKATFLVFHVTNAMSE